jgi:hypothetical protein
MTTTGEWIPASVDFGSAVFDRAAKDALGAVLVSHLAVGSRMTRSPDAGILDVRVLRWTECLEQGL